MSTDSNPRASTTDRRTFLAAAGALGVGALVVPQVLAAPAPGPVKSALTEEGVCSITPSATAGPFYLASTVLQDITGGKPGLPFFLFLQVVHASDCTKIPGAEVDVWHADAKGLYSGVAQQGTLGQTWLRGTQVTNGKGIVGFTTIYPGLYPGRAAHFHIKVRPNPNVELTSQLYFPDAVTALVHQFIAPYNVNPPPQTLNQNDGIFTPATVLNLEIHQGPFGLLGWLIIGVNA